MHLFVCPFHLHVNCTPAMQIVRPNICIKSRPASLDTFWIEGVAEIVPTLLYVEGSNEDLLRLAFGLERGGFCCNNGDCSLLLISLFLQKVNKEKKKRIEKNSEKVI